MFNFRGAFLEGFWSLRETSEWGRVLRPYSIRICKSLTLTAKPGTSQPSTPYNPKPLNPKPLESFRPRLRSATLLRPLYPKSPLYSPRLLDPAPHKQPPSRDLPRFSKVPSPRMLLAFSAPGCDQRSGATALQEANLDGLL